MGRRERSGCESAGRDEPEHSTGLAYELVLGAQAGLFFGTYACRWSTLAGAYPTAFAITGMAAFFTATVRAPVTGIILVIELTASGTQLLPMLAACFTAMAVPTLFGEPPIYDSFAKRT